MRVQREAIEFPVKIARIYQAIILAPYQPDSAMRLYYMV